MSRAKRKFNTVGESDDNVRELGRKKKLTLHDMKSFRAMTENQEDFLRLYYQDLPLLMGTGVAGSGKTFLSIAAALTDVLDPSSPYTSITIVRSTVEVRGQGFLKGDLADKEEPYEQPYKSIFKELLKFNNPYDHAKALGYVNFLSTSFLRGTTFRDTIVIVDEMQNLDYSELSTVITRCGDNCRIIFVGDNVQGDLQRKREVSGFNEFMRVVNRMPSGMVGQVEFDVDDIVRSGIVKQFIIAENQL